MLDAMYVLIAAGRIFHSVRFVSVFGLLTVGWRGGRKEGTTMERCFLSV